MHYETSLKISLRAYYGNDGSLVLFRSPRLAVVYFIYQLEYTEEHAVGRLTLASAEARLHQGISNKIHHFGFFNTYKDAKDHVTKRLESEVFHNTLDAMLGENDE